MSKVIGYLIIAGAVIAAFVYLVVKPFKPKTWVEEAKDIEYRARVLGQQITPAERKQLDAWYNFTDFTGQQLS